MSPDSKQILESILKRDRSLTEVEKHALNRVLKGPVFSMAAPSDPLQTMAPPTMLMSRAMVAEKLGVSISTVERLQAVGEITPVYVTADAPRFIAEEIHTFIARRKARPAHHGAREKAMAAP